MNNVLPPTTSLPPTVSVVSSTPSVFPPPEPIIFDANGSPRNLPIDSIRIAWLNQRPYFVHQFIGRGGFAEVRLSGESICDYECCD